MTRRKSSVDASSGAANVSWTLTRLRRLEKEPRSADGERNMPLKLLNRPDAGPELGVVEVARCCAADACRSVGTPARCGDDVRWLAYDDDMDGRDRPVWRDVLRKLGLNSFWISSEAAR